jgi:putative transposase
MSKGVFREDQIASIVKQLNSGHGVTELSREHGISRATLYVWKAKYSNKRFKTDYRLRQLEEENRRLKQLIGELCLEIGSPLKGFTKRTHAIWGSPDASLHGRKRRKEKYEMVNNWLAVAAGLCLFVTPVMADDDDARETFIAISEIEGPNEQGALSTLPDSHLDSIEGVGICFGCPSINLSIAVAPITQFNIINQVSFALGRNITQSSFASAINNTGGIRGGR